MEEKIMELLQNLKVCEFIASRDILDHLELEPTQKNFKVLRAIMTEFNFQATSYKGKKGYKKIEIEETHVDLEEEIQEEMPYFEDKFLDDDTKFIINLNRCIDYLSHMKLKSDIIDTKVDEIIYKFNKKHLFSIQ